VKHKTSLDITHELFQLMKQFPRPKLKRSSANGLTPSEYELLAMLVINLDEGKTAFTVTELSNMLQITPAGVTHLVNPLEESGYIRRLADSNDRRIVRIGLTEKGTQTAETLILEVRELLIGLVEYLGEEDSLTLIGLMTKAVNYFSSHLEI